MRVDLHVHSTASDGSLAPAEVVAAARAGRLDIIALADHDTTAGVAEAQAEAGPPAVVPAIEVSSTHGGEDLHVLGYFVDPAHPALLEHGRRAQDRRRERMRGMIRRLAALGVDVAYDDVLAEAGDAPLGRPHLARALVKAGHVRVVSEAFDRFIADGAPAFLPIELLTPRDAIELIHAAGGVAVWAHPRLGVLERELAAFVEWGLEGIECYRPLNSTAETRRLVDAAGRHGLLTTGGSDWHGVWHGRLGDFSIARSRVETLLEIGGM